MQIPHAMRPVVLEHFLRVRDDEQQEWPQRSIYSTYIPKAPTKEKEKRRRWPLPASWVVYVPCSSLTSHVLS